MTRSTRGAGVPHLLTDDTIRELNGRVWRAAKKHGPMDSDALCLGALHLELSEAAEEMQARDPIRTYEELLDVATVAIRRAQVIASEGL